MTLLDSELGKEYTIDNLLIEDELISSRFYKLGFYPGALVTKKRKAPLFGDPILFQIGDSQVVLTKSESKLIEVSLK